MAISAAVRVSPCSGGGVQRVSNGRWHAMEAEVAACLGLLSHARPPAQAGMVAAESNKNNLRRLARAATEGGGALQDVGEGMARLEV